MTVEEAARLVTECVLSGGTVYVCGNGGSMAAAQHFVGELVGAFLNRQRRPLAAATLGVDPVTLTAIANDFGFKNVFARELMARGYSGDLLLAISTSGNSENVLEAVSAARVLEMDVIALTAGNGGQLALEVDNVLCAPMHDTPAAQEWHDKVLHEIAAYVEINACDFVIPLNETDMGKA